MAIFDGHAGAGASTLASQRFTKVLAATKHWQRYLNTMRGSVHHQEVCVTPISSGKGENKRYATRSRSSNDSGSDSGVRRIRKNSISSNTSSSSSSSGRSSSSRSSSFCSEEDDGMGREGREGEEKVGARAGPGPFKVSPASPAPSSSGATLAAAPASSSSSLSSRRGNGATNTAINTAINTEATTTATTTTASLGLVRAALVEAYLEMDRELRDAECMDGSGSTAVVALLTPTHIVCASVGDSRCILACDSKCVALSEDHRPMDRVERERIERVGHFVAVGRVNGELAMSRALGDFQYKHDKRGRSSFSSSQANSQAQAALLPPREQAVSCLPDVVIRERGPADQVLVLASDGVWDVLGNQDVVTFIAEYLPRQRDMSTQGGGGRSSTGGNGGRKPAMAMAMTEAARAVVELSLRQGSSDNISVAIARLSTAPAASSPTVRVRDEEEEDEDEDGGEDTDDEGAATPRPPSPPAALGSGSGKGIKRKQR